MKELILRKFKTKRGKSRQIGIEVELPLVDRLGMPAPISMIRKMYHHLQAIGADIRMEDEVFSEAILPSVINNAQEVMVTTDLGYSTIEVILPPLTNLHDAQRELARIIDILVVFFAPNGYFILGYGIHPVAKPSLHLQSPKKRYRILERLWKTHLVVPPHEGNDGHLLTVSAGNQCHIDIDDDEMFMANQVLNVTSALQIALQANSPVWQSQWSGKQAAREYFYDLILRSAHLQKRYGIAPLFKNIEEYVNYLCHEQILIIYRDGQALEVRGYNFQEYLQQSQVEVFDVDNNAVWVQPALTDLHAHCGLLYLNARLVPRFGTIEVRMPCQQPPNEALVTAAISLGLLENLEKATEFIQCLKASEWHQLRRDAIAVGLQTTLHGNTHNFHQLLHEILNIAEEGLKKRGWEEEVFLKPLFDRLETQQNPADKALAIFTEKGVEGIVELLQWRSSNS